MHLLQMLVEVLPCNLQMKSAHVLETLGITRNSFNPIMQALGDLLPWHDEGKCLSANCIPMAVLLQAHGHQMTPVSLYVVYDHSGPLR